MAGTLTHEAGIRLKRAQEIIGHACGAHHARDLHALPRTHDDSADKVAALAGLPTPPSDL
jgi:hypothetical protein